VSRGLTRYRVQYVRGAETYRQKMRDTALCRDTWRTVAICGDVTRYLPLTCLSPLCPRPRRQPTLAPPRPPHALGGLPGGHIGHRTRRAGGDKRNAPAPDRETERRTTDDQHMLMQAHQPPTMSGSLHQPTSGGRAPPRLAACEATRERAARTTRATPIAPWLASRHAAVWEPMDWRG
jgi:hypothetical protein